MKQYAKENWMPVKNQVLNNKTQKTSSSINKAAFKNSIITSVMAFIFTFSIGILLSSHFIKLFQSRAPFTISYLQITPEGAFTSAAKLAILFGIYLSAPFIIYQFAKFKLNHRFNKEFLITNLLTGFILFTLGILFAYYALIPITLYFLLGFNFNTGATNFSISSYTEFCTRVIIFSGMAFELPVFLKIMSKTNFIDSKKLLTHWKKVIIGAFVLSVILTSSELFTQIMYTLMILSFYGIAIATAKITNK